MHRFTFIASALVLGLSLGLTGCTRAPSDGPPRGPAPSGGPSRSREARTPRQPVEVLPAEFLTRARPLEHRFVRLPPGLAPLRLRQGFPKE